MKINIDPTAGVIQSPNMEVGEEPVSDNDVVRKIDLDNLETDSVSQEEFDQLLNDFDSHESDISNPHNVTSSQVNALSKDGGTLSGNLNVEGNIQVNDKIEGNIGSIEFDAEFFGSTALGMGFDTHGIGIVETGGVFITTDLVVTDDLTVDGQIDENGERIATRTWSNSNFNNYTFSENYTDLSNRTHGNEDHSETFATELYVDGEVFSGSYNDLTNVPLEFTPETHGNEAHSETFATESYADSAYTDSDAINALEGATLNDLTVSTTLTTDYISGEHGHIDLNESYFNNEPSVMIEMSNDNGFVGMGGFGQFIGVNADTNRAEALVNEFFINGGDLVVDNGNLEVDGTIWENNDRVATRNWTTSNFNDYTDSDAVSAIEAADPLVLSGAVTTESDFTVDTTGDAEHLFTSTGDSGTYRATYELNSTGLYIGHNSSSRNLILTTDNTDAIIVSGSQNVNTPNGTLSEQGNRVATRDWTIDNFNDYSDSQAVSAVEDNGLAHLAITNNLSVGGSTTLQSDLDVDGDTSIGTSASGRTLNVGGWTYSSDGLLVGDSDWEGQFGWDSTGYIQIGTNVGTADAIRVHESNDFEVAYGDVEIPNGDLDVNGSIFATFSGGLGHKLIYDDTLNWGHDDAVTLQGDNTAGGEIFEVFNGNNDQKFYINGSGNSAIDGRLDVTDGYFRFLGEAGANETLPGLILRNEDFGTDHQVEMRMLITNSDTATTRGATMRTTRYDGGGRVNFLVGNGDDTTDLLELNGPDGEVAIPNGDFVVENAIDAGGPLTVGATNNALRVHSGSTAGNIAEFYGWGSSHHFDIGYRDSFINNDEYTFGCRGNSGRRMLWMDHSDDRIYIEMDDAADSLHFRTKSEFTQPVEINDNLEVDGDIDVNTVDLSSTLHVRDPWRGIRFHGDHRYDIIGDEEWRIYDDTESTYRFTISDDGRVVIEDGPLEVDGDSELNGDLEVENNFNVIDGDVLISNGNISTFGGMNSNSDININDNRIVGDEGFVDFSMDYGGLNVMAIGTSQDGLFFDPNGGAIMVSELTLEENTTAENILEVNNENGFMIDGETQPKIIITSDDNYTPGTNELVFYQE